MNKKLILSYAAVTTAATLSSHASLTWTGGGDEVSLYQEANWLEDDGSALEAGEINGNTDVTADTGGLIEITTGTGTPSNFGGNFQVGSGNSLTVGGGKVLQSNGGSNVVGGGAATTLTVTGSGSKLNVGDVSNFGTIAATGSTVNLAVVTDATDVSLTNVSGSIDSLTMGSGTVAFTGTGLTFTTVDITGVTGNIENMSITNGSITEAGANPTFGNLTLSNSTASFGGLQSSATFPSQVYLTNGSSWVSTFITEGSHLFADATSSIQLNGGGDPLNSQTEQSTVNLETGAQLIFSNTEELADQLNDSGTGDIWVNGTRVTDANWTTLLSTSDNFTYVAVPEPSSTALLGLGGLALIFRRRK